MRLRSRQVTVLDIQDRYVRCSQLRYHNGKWSILRSLQEEIQSTDLDTSSIIKSLLQQMPSNDLIVSISGRDTSIKLLELPPLNDKRFKNIDGILRYELGPQLPMDIDQMYYDYQIVEMDNVATTLLTVSIKRSVLTRYIDILSQAGVSPDIITISSTGLYNAFLMSHPHKTGHPIGLICLRESTGDVVIIERGHLTYARSFNISDNNTVREINNSFDAYFRTHASKTEMSQIPIYMIHTGEEKHLDLTDVMPNISLKWYTLDDNYTSGAAMSGTFKPFHSHYLKINLLRQVVQEERGAKKKEARTKLLRFAPAISIIILIVISCILWWQTTQAKDNLHAIEVTLQTNVKQLNDASALRDTAKMLDKQIESLGWVTEEYPMVSYRLYRIAQMVPDSVWLKGVYIPEVHKDKNKKQENPVAKINVAGYAQEQGQIESFLENLRRCDCFSDVRQESASEITVAGDRLLEFEIGLTSSKYGTINQWRTIKD